MWLTGEWGCGIPAECSSVYADGLTVPAITRSLDLLAQEGHNSAHTHYVLECQFKSYAG